MPLHGPTALQPPLKLPLYDFQLRNIARCKTIETYADGRSKNDFGTFLEYTPKGGVIADGTGLGKTATVLGLIFSEPKTTQYGKSSET